MAQQINRTNLGFLGETYQYKLVHELMSCESFFKDLIDIINQNAFTDPQLRMFVGMMKDYYHKVEAFPTYDTMEIVAREKSASPLQLETYLAVIDKIKNTPSDGSDYVQENATKFFRQQNIIRAAKEILEIAGNGDTAHYDKCVDLLSDAIVKGTHEDTGSTVFDNIGDTLSDDYRVTIPTGVGKIDETLEGGLGKGELGVIVGPSSFGKTSLTTAIASHAASEGFKVLQIIFEDRVKQIQRKHIARLVGIESKDLSKDAFKEKVREQLETYERENPERFEALKKNLRIVRFPSGEKTAWDIERFIKKLINNGFRPDLVIVDYFECLEHKSDDKSANEWEKEGKTMRKFEAMAGELDMAFWVPLQGTRDSVSAELVTMDKAGGSFKKIQIAHIVMSIARSLDDIKDNKATIAILKNRAGQAGKVFNGVEFNNGTCRISTDNTEDYDDMVMFRNNQEKNQFDLTKDVWKRVANKK